MDTNRRILAIDPGFSGGLAYLDGQNVSVYKMPSEVKELAALLRSFVGRVDTVVVENVGTYRPGNSGPAAVTFSRHVGAIDGILAALCFPNVLWVVPRVWMAVFPNLPHGLDQKKERKNFIKAKMIRAFPSEKITLWNSDALGILYWFRWKEF